MCCLQNFTLIAIFSKSDKLNGQEQMSNIKISIDKKYIVCKHITNLNHSLDWHNVQILDFDTRYQYYTKINVQSDAV